MNETSNEPPKNSDKVGVGITLAVAGTMAGAVLAVPFVGFLPAIVVGGAFVAAVGGAHLLAKGRKSRDSKQKADE